MFFNLLVLNITNLCCKQQPPSHSPKVLGLTMDHQQINQGHIYFFRLSILSKVKVVVVKFTTSSQGYPFHI